MYIRNCLALLSNRLAIKSDNQGRKSERSSSSVVARAATLVVPLTYLSSQIAKVRYIIPAPCYYEHSVHATFKTRSVISSQCHDKSSNVC